MTSLKKKIASDTQIDGSLEFTAGHTNYIWVEDQAQIDNDLTLAKDGLKNGVLTTDANGNVVKATATVDELNRLSGVTSNIQTQINGKAQTNHASSGTTYGVGTDQNYGHVKFKQTISGESTDTTVSEKGVRDFVNSSISTATANFLGTYTALSLGFTQQQIDAFTDPPTSQIETSVATAIATKLASLSITPTNNDYVFVSVNKSTTTDVDWFWRFKYNGTVWLYEYTLNNSSFTQAQWDAINSGVTTGDVSAIRSIGNGTVTVLNSGAESIGSFTLNQSGDTTIVLPDGSTQYLNQSATFVLQDVPDYADYPYRASVPITNMTHTMFANVVFSDEQVDSGAYSPMCETYDGGVYVYANADVGTITIPTISAGYDTSLALDSVPTQNSTNAVMSGGVWSAIGSDSRVVHTTGDETINGVKTFNNSIVGNSNLYLNGQYSKYIYFNSQNGTNHAYIQSASNGSIILTPGVQSGDTKSVMVDQRDYNSSNESDVVTVKTLKQSADVVHTSGNETIAGIKTFTSDMYLTKTNTSRFRCKSTGLVRGTMPASATSAGGFIVLNNNDDVLMGLTHTLNTTGKAYASWFIRDYNGANLKEAVLHTDGYLTAPNRSYNTSNISDVITIGMLKDATSPININGSVLYNKKCVVGQTSDIASISGPVRWYKVASTTISSGYTDTTVKFRVWAGFGGETISNSGILTAHLRTQTSTATVTSHFIWESALYNIVPSNYIMLVKPGDASNPATIEIWTYVNTAYQRRFFEELVEGNISAFTNQWELFNNSYTGTTESEGLRYTASGFETYVTTNGFTSIESVTGTYLGAGAQLTSTTPWLQITKTNLSRSYSGYTQAGGMQLNCNDGTIGGLYSLRSTPLGSASSGMYIYSNNATGGQKTLTLWSRDDGTGYLETSAYDGTPVGLTSVLTAGNGVTLTTAQTITGTKTFNAGGFTDLVITTNRTGNENIGGVSWFDSNNNRVSQIYSHLNGSLYLNSNAGMGVRVVGQRTYSASNTGDIVTIGSLQASTDVVHTSGTETIAGAKSFTSEMTNERNTNFPRCYTVKASGIFTEDANPTEDKTIWPLIIGNGNLTKFPFRIATIQRPNGDFITEFSLRDPQTNVERANLRLTSPTSGTGKLEFYNGSQWSTISQ